LGKTGSSDKNSRFIAVQQGKAPSKLPAHEVITYVGDNVEDFPGMRQKMLIDLPTTDTAFQKFGKEWFLLPNPIYGSWTGNPQR